MCEMGSYKDATEQKGDKVGASASKVEEMQSRIRSLEEELCKKDELQKQEKFASQVEQFLQMKKQVQRTLCGMGDCKDTTGQLAENISTSDACASKMEEMQSRIHSLEELHKQEKFAAQMQQEQLQRRHEQYWFSMQLVDRISNLGTNQAKITKYLKIMPVQQQESGQPPLQYATRPSFQRPGYGSPFDNSQQTNFGYVQPIQDSQPSKFGSSTQVQGSHLPMPQPVQQVRNSQSPNFQASQPTKDNRVAYNNVKGQKSTAEFGSSIRLQGSQFPQPPRPLPVQPVQLVPKPPTPNLQGSQPTKDKQGADRNVRGQKSDPKYGGPKE